MLVFKQLFTLLKVCDSIQRIEIIENDNIPSLNGHKFTGNIVKSFENFLIREIAGVNPPTLGIFSIIWACIIKLFTAVIFPFNLWETTIRLES
jgi:hypothetical protein